MLQEYKYGGKAPLTQCLFFTMSESLQHMDLSSIDLNNMQIKLKTGDWIEVGSTQTITS